MLPSFVYADNLCTNGNTTRNATQIEELELREVQDIFEEEPIILPECHQYYVELGESDEGSHLTCFEEEEIKGSRLKAD